MSNKCSDEPQAVNKDVWYYEFPSAIEIHVQRGNLQTVILVPRRKLEASLKRMNASRRKRSKCPVCKEVNSMECIVCGKNDKAESAGGK